jgi:hypothetical protein
VAKYKIELPSRLRFVKSPLGDDGNLPVKLASPDQPEDVKVNEEVLIF